MIVKLCLPSDDAIHEYVFDRSEALIGSSHRTDIHIPLPDVGRRHARLRRRRDRLWLEPLKPGTTLVIERNKVGRIKSASPIALLAGDVVHIGSSTQIALVEIVSIGEPKEASFDLTTLCRLSDTPLPPTANVFEAASRLAVEAPRTRDVEELTNLLSRSIRPIVDDDGATCGMVLFGTTDDAPLIVLPNQLESLLGAQGSLMRKAQWRQKVTLRLTDGEVLTLPEETDTHAYLVPILQEKNCLGFWVLSCAAAVEPTRFSPVASFIGCLLVQHLNRLDRQRELRLLREEIHYFRNRERRHYLYKDLVTESPSMKAVYEDVHRLVDESGAVWIQGEKGTGKEMVARALHHLGPKADSLMISQNCASMPEEQLDHELFGSQSSEETQEHRPIRGVLELTRDGTLFLEQIEQLPIRLQAKLSRAIQEGEVRPEGETISRPIDLRIVVSSECDLFSLVESGCFRKDLYLQLAQHTIALPPLRERKEDIVPLANVLLSQLAGRYRKPIDRIGDNLHTVLKEYPWPGNVRELQGYVEAAIISAPDDAEELTSIPGLYDEPVG